MKQSPAGCDYGQPDIFIPYGSLDFNRLGQKAEWKKELTMKTYLPYNSWCTESPCMFEENLFPAFKCPVRLGTQLALDQKVPSSARDR